jgi:hypothetical protein
MSENQDDDDPPPVYLDGIIDGWIRMPKGMDVKTENEWLRSQDERCKALDAADLRRFEFAMRVFARLTKDNDYVRFIYAFGLWLDAQKKYDVEHEMEVANCDYGGWRHCYEQPDSLLQDDPSSEKSDEAAHDGSHSRPELDRGDDRDIGQQPEDDSSSRSGEDPE